MHSLPFPMPLLCMLAGELEVGAYGIWVLHPVALPPQLHSNLFEPRPSLEALVFTGRGVPHNRPFGGDELQGIKRGIMEIADLILVNKADGDLKAAATRTSADYAGALRLLRRRPGDPPGYPSTMLVSALDGHELHAAWDKMQTLAD